MREEGGGVSLTSGWMALNTGASIRVIWPWTRMDMDERHAKPPLPGFRSPEI